MLPAWNQRPVIVANLTNPAFCGKIIHAFIKGFNSKSNSVFPYSLSFFILPFILHRKTREIIPSSRTRKSLHTWLEENPSIKIDLISRITSFKSFTRESLLFLSIYDAIEIRTDGTINCKSLENGHSSQEPMEEVLDCFEKAETLGKIFARSGTPLTIYSLIGVKP